MKTSTIGCGIFTLQRNSYGQEDKKRKQTVLTWIQARFHKTKTLFKSSEVKHIKSIHHFSLLKVWMKHTCLCVH